MRSTLMIGILCCILCCVVQAVQAASTVYDIPRLDHITLDGKGDDWSARGFRVDVLHDMNGDLLDVLPRRDVFNATVRLGWDTRGLLALIKVIDANLVESDNEAQLWQRSSVELNMAEKVGSPDFYQVVIGPGMDGKHAAVRHWFFDNRSSVVFKTVPLQVSAACTKTADGYLMEVLLPWSNLGITPILGRELGVQAMINTFDGQGLWHQLWYPIPKAAFFSDRMNTVRLAMAPSPPVQLEALCTNDHLRHLVVSIAGTSEQIGKTLTIRDGTRRLGTAKLTADGGGGSMASVFLPFGNGNTYASLTASVGDQHFPVDPSSSYWEREQAIYYLPVTFSNYVFNDATFPLGDFADPALAENLLGRYCLRIAYYDAAYHRVASAETPGRYGALVTATGENGITLRRYVTLYRLPSHVDWKSCGEPITTQLLAECGLNPEVIKEQARTIKDLRKQVELSHRVNLTDSTAFPIESLRQQYGYGLLASHADCAIYLAGLAETRPGDALAPWSEQSVYTRNSRWWHGLRRQLGITESYPYLLLHPDNFDAAKRYPLIIALNGAGDPERDFATFKKEPYDKGLIAFTHAQFPCIVAIPHMRDIHYNDDWNSEMLDEMLAEILAHEPVDPDRVYLTGRSMGGNGVWRTAYTYPERFAAIAPVSAPKIDEHEVIRLKDMPIWVFHGGADSVVILSESQSMVDALTASGGHPKFTVYPGVGHSAWEKAYADPAFYAWLFQQRRK